MQYIYNTTFFIDPLAETEFLEWLRPLVETRLCSSEGMNPRLSRLCAVPGGDLTGQPMSISLQVEFDTPGEAELWGGEILLPVTEEFNNRFAPSAMSFSSIFEKIPI